MGRCRLYAIFAAVSWADGESAIKRLIGRLEPLSPALFPLIVLL